MKLVEKKRGGFTQFKVSSGSPTHVLLLGKTDSGKTVTAETLITQMFHKGYKIVSLYNTHRWESAFWTFPAQNKWQINIREKYGLKCYGLPIKVHCPISKGMPDYLPNICVPFSIPICEMSDDEMAFLGSRKPSSSQIQLVGMALEKMNKKSTVIKFILEVRKLIESKTIKIEEIPFRTPFTKATQKVITRFVKPFLQEPIVSSGISPHALDLEPILNDNSYVSVFVQAYLPFNLRCLVVSYLIRKIFDLYKDHKISVPLILYIEEMRDMFPGETDNPILSKVRETGAEIARGARGVNINFYGVVQSPNDLYDEIRRQMMTKYIFWMDDPSDLAFLRESGRRLNQEEFGMLSMFRSGQCFVIEKAQPLKYIQQIIPPPFHHRMPTDFFFKMFKRMGGKFIPSKPFIDVVNEEKNRDKREYLEYEEEIRTKKIERKRKKLVTRITDYDKILEIIHSFYSIRRMEFERKDLEEADPKLNKRSIQKVLKKMSDEGILKIIGKGRSRKYRIMRL